MLFPDDFHPSEVVAKVAGTLPQRPKKVMFQIYR